jgi:hypothetical protein
LWAVQLSYFGYLAWEWDKLVAGRLPRPDCWMRHPQRKFYLSPWAYLIDSSAFSGNGQFPMSLKMLGFLILAFLAAH